MHQQGVQQLGESKHSATALAAQVHQLSNTHKHTCKQVLFLKMQLKGAMNSAGQPCRTCVPADEVFLGFQAASTPTGGERAQPCMTAGGLMQEQDMVLMGIYK